jgi:spore germination protein
MLRKLVVVFIIMSLLAAFVPATSASSGYCVQYHYVQYGETLFRIALRYHTTVGYLRSINYIPNPNRIYAGTSLCVRTGTPPGSPYVVQYGDTLFRIARRFGVNLYHLAQYNNIYNLNRIYAGQVLYIPGW